MTSFGNLQEKRLSIRSGLSQRALAQEADIDTSYISRLESGNREVTSRSLALKLAEIMVKKKKKIYG